MLPIYSPKESIALDLVVHQLFFILNVMVQMCLQGFFFFFVQLQMRADISVDSKQSHMTGVQFPVTDEARAKLTELKNKKLSLVQLVSYTLLQNFRNRVSLTFCVFVILFQLFGPVKLQGRAKKGPIAKMHALKIRR